MVYIDKRAVLYQAVIMKEKIFREQKEVVERLRKMREDMGYSQEKFSDALDISLSAYVKVENFDRYLSLNNLKKLHDTFNISADHILFGDAVTLEDAWFSVVNCSYIDKMIILSRLIQCFSGDESGARWGSESLTEDFAKLVTDIIPNYGSGNNRED